MSTTGRDIDEHAPGQEETRRDRRGALRQRCTIALLVAITGVALASCGGDGGGTLGGSLPEGTIDSGTRVTDDGSNGADITLPAADVGDQNPVGDADQTDDQDQTGGDNFDEDSSVVVQPTEPAVDDGTDDGLTTEQWVAVVLLGVAVIALVAGLAAVASRRSSDRRQQQAQTQHRRDDIIGGCRWAHDQAALTVLSTSDPAMLRSTWTTIERQLLELESRIAGAQAAAESGADPDLIDAARVVSALRGALAADVALRAGSATPAPDLVNQSRQTVLDRTRDLETVTARLSMARV